MKKGKTGQSNLIVGGKERFEKTEEFSRKVEEIKRDVSDKYSLTILNEKNLVKRIYIVCKREIEIRSRITELSSLKNLHTMRHGQI